MNVQLFNLEKVAEGKVELPSQFNETVRPALIARAVITLQLNERQPYGSNPQAGARSSAQVSRRRKKYRGSYGKGISRVPRKILSRKGMQINWQGAVAPGTVKGRRAHPPKAYQIWDKKINKKENNKAIRSALAATLEKELVAKRGHVVPQDYPFVINDSITALNKTKAVKEALNKLGFEAELKRTSKKTLRAGRGKTRGRKYHTKIGPLIVVAKNCALQKSASNILGAEVVLVDKLNPELLAPGATAGRLMLFTISAINKLKNEKLFM
jgi:large subunit ribosomal protein L4e